jgi:hypothetical protein
MTDDTTAFDIAGLQAQLTAAAAALREFSQGPAQRAADDLSAAFERAGARIARALGDAAMGGEDAFKRLAKVILEELAKIVLPQILSQVGSGLSLFGGRAAGGRVKSASADRNCSCRRKRARSRSRTAAPSPSISISVPAPMRTASPGIKARSPPPSRAPSPMGDATCDHVP